MRPTRNQVERILEHLPAAVLQSDESGTIIFANAIARDLFGNDLVGQRAATLYGATSESADVGPKQIKAVLELAPDRKLKGVFVALKTRTSSPQPMMCLYAADDQGQISGVVLPEIGALIRSITKVIESVFKARSFDETLACVSHEARTVTGADRAYLKLYDPARNVLIFKALSSVDSHERFREEYSQPARGMTGHVYRVGRPYRSGDVRKEAENLFYAIFPDTISKIAVPLLNPDPRGDPQSYGVLTVDGKKEWQFGLDAEESLICLAKHAAVTIATSKRFAELGATYDEILGELRYAQEVVLVQNLLHDGKNMVRSVVHELDAIQRELNGTPFGKRKASELQIRVDKLKNLNDLMGHMLAQARGSDRVEDLRGTESCDLARIARRAVSVVPSSEIPILISLEFEGAQYPVYGKETKLLSLVYNLLSNAVSAMKNSGRLGEIAITLSATPQRAGFRRVQIADTGPGLPRPVLEFIRKGEKYSGIPGGTGLGLISVRQTVNDLGGSISVDSRLGSGTTFTIDLKGPILSQETTR